MRDEHQTRKRKNPTVALALGWFAPGAGHYYVLRRDKAVVFALAICATFLFGLAMTRMRGVFFFESSTSARGFSGIALGGTVWEKARTVTQLLNGLPAIAAAAGAWMAGIGDDPADLPKYYNLGLYTIWISGLLNLLVAMDASLEAAGLKRTRRAGKPASE